MGGFSSSLSLNSISMPVNLPMPQLPGEAAKGMKAAREFEAQLIGNLLESMEKTFSGLPGEPSVAGEDNYDYLGTHALATAMADAGGFGIADLIARHLGPMQPTTEPSIAPRAQSTTVPGLATDDR